MHKLFQISNYSGSCFMWLIWDRGKPITATNRKKSEWTLDNLPIWINFITVANLLHYLWSHEAINTAILNSIIFTQFFWRFQFQTALSALLFDILLEKDQINLWSNQHCGLHHWSRRDRIRESSDDRCS